MTAVSSENVSARLTSIKRFNMIAIFLVFYFLYTQVSKQAQLLGKTTNPLNSNTVSTPFTVFNQNLSKSSKWQIEDLVEGGIIMR